MPHSIIQRFSLRAGMKFSVLSLVVVSLLLAGCINVQSNIALHGEGEWHGLTALQVSGDFAQMMEEGNTTTTEPLEGGGTVTTETSMETEGIDDWLAQAEEAANRDDLNVTFNEVRGEDGSLNYLLQADGQDLDTLNETMFNGEADISVEVVNGQRQVTIRADVSDTTEGSSSDGPPTPEELQMMKAFGMGITFRISGGEIISSNATRVEGNTAVWEFPTIIEVTLTEAPTFSPKSIELQAAPSGGFSLGALEAMMGEFDTDMTQSAGGATTNPANTETSTELPTDAPASTPGETTTMEATENAATMNLVEDTTAQAAAPSAEENNLPQAGGILPDHTSPALVIMAGLTLLVLGGGATLNLLKHS